MLYRITFFTLYLFFVSCAPAPEVNTKLDLSFIKNVQARELLSKAIAGSGGEESWSKFQALNFQKDFELYLEDGTVEQSASQTHSHQLINKTGTITWKKENEQHELKYDGTLVQKFLNAKIDTSYSSDRAKNSVLSALFVMLLPKNLVDPTAVIEYAGREKIGTGINTEKLKVTYNPEKFSEHTTEDTWWLYFDDQDYKLIQYKVKHKDHISLVENLGFQKISGIVLPTERESWRLDEQGNKLYLRAKYQYQY